MNTKDKIQLDLIGKKVIAKDEYWGNYKGEIVDTYNKALSDTLMARVRIIEMINAPIHKAILYKENTYHRDPYPVGSLQVFYLENIEFFYSEEG